MTLDDLRHQIDAVDDELLRLLNQRADLVHGVGEIKHAQGLEIYAPEREEKLLQSLVNKSQGRLSEKSIRAIYREIMSAALALEQNLSIAYLGPEGTWTHQAALSKFGSSVGYDPAATAREVFDKVADRSADYGVLPLEIRRRRSRPSRARPVRRITPENLRADSPQRRNLPDGKIRP